MLLLVLGGCTPGVSPVKIEDTAVRADSAMDTGDSGGHTTETGGQDQDSADTGHTGDDSDDSGHTDTADSAAPADTADSSEPVTPSGALVIYALRHAEKEDEGDDPGLTEEGAARALALVDVMHDVPLAAIYATDLARTQETVQPTAEDHGLETITDIDAETELADHLLATHAEQTVLHCGHSYTLPDLFDALGLDPEPDVDGYGQLWIVTIEADGTSSWVETRYGE